MVSVPLCRCTVCGFDIVVNLAYTVRTVVRKSMPSRSLIRTTVRLWYHKPAVPVVTDNVLVI